MRYNEKRLVERRKRGRGYQLGIRKRKQKVSVSRRLVTFLGFGYFILAADHIVFIRLHVTLLSHANEIDHYVKWLAQRT